MKKIIRLLFSLVLLFTITVVATGCQKEDENVITIGTMQQPGEPILESIKEAYEAKGYILKWELYTSFELPNTALAEGSIDANLFQHEPYLNTYNAANGTDLFCAAKLYDCVYGGYTKKNIESVNEIPEGAKVSIATDASNKSRCLFILEAAGLIEIDDTVTTATIDDITSNPKNLKIVEMSTASIASSLDDDDTYLGIVNATFAISAGLTDAELLCKEEDADHVNANILACRSDEKNEQWLKDLVEVLTSDNTAEFITEEFKGTIIPYFVSKLGK